MKRTAIFLLSFLLLFSGCTVPGGSESEGSSSGMMNEDTSTNSKTSLPGAGGSSGRFHIEFTYSNYIYQYDLQAKWSNVAIASSGTQHASGIEILLDGTPQVFEECDTDGSGILTREEWSDFEEDISFSVLDINGDGKVTLQEFERFTGQLSGAYLFPHKHTISQPKHKDYAIAMEESDGPVSLKILRAGKGGYNAGNGIVFAEGTVFIELESDFQVQLKSMPDFELPPGFLTPLLSMYLEQDYEQNNHGALGFSSIVNTKEFSGIFSGKTFTLHYEGKGESGVLDVYDLTITPAG